MNLLTLQLPVRPQSCTVSQMVDLLQPAELGKDRKKLSLTEAQLSSQAPLLRSA